MKYRVEIPVATSDRYTDRWIEYRLHDAWAGDRVEKLNANPGSIEVDVPDDAPHLSEQMLLLDAPFCSFTLVEQNSTGSRRLTRELPVVRVG